MVYKILIIDDNHSFIDTLQVSLKDLSLQFEHTFRYSDAEKTLLQSGALLNREAVALLTEYESQWKTYQESVAKGDSAIAQPALELENIELIKEGGIFLIIIEQSTESNVKGTDFITVAMRKNPNFTENDFVLLTHRLSTIPQKNYGFPIFEKPLKSGVLKQLISAKIKSVEEILDRFDKLKAASLAEKKKHQEINPPKIKKSRIKSLLTSNNSNPEEAQSTDTTPKAGSPRPLKSQKKKSNVKSPKKSGQKKKDIPFKNVKKSKK